MKLALDFQKKLEDALKQEEMPAGATIEILIQHAIELEASDIHLEPQKEKMLIRFRLDGVLHDIGFLPKPWQPRLVAKIKVLANLLTYREDIAQEGRITEFSAPLRVSIFPTLFGEKTTIRLFHDTRIQHELKHLGFEQKTLQKIEEVLFRPQGMFLLTGPSGSGKTTTIYGMIKAMNRHFQKSKAIITIEDPVEVPLNNIVQTQLNRAVDLDFKGSLRTILRHDPDIIMIGEIRDKETAEIAIEAGLTGHFIISTIHSGRAIGVFSRLLDMGIEHYLITSALSAVLAQRLIRMRCVTCLESLNLQCKECHGTGYKGRTVIYEFIPVEGPIRKAILEHADFDLLKLAMKEMNCETLMECAQRAVERQKTHHEEIARVLG